MLGISMPPRTLMKEALRIFFTRKANSEDVLDTLCKKVEINLAEPQKYTIDGELFGPTSKIVVEIGPGFDVIVG